MTTKTELAASLLLATVAAGCSATPHGAPDLDPVAARLACASLAGATIPIAAIGLPTGGAEVLAAVDVADTDTGGVARSYCKVTGNIRPVDSSASPIRFQVNLPTTWNRRLLQFGGGGTNGTVVTGIGNFTGQPNGTPTALARGYVTLGSDSGHDSAGKPPFDTSFALNQEELLNFGQQQIKKTRDVAVWLVDRTYGRKARSVYFAGGSQGGHEAFDAAQRYPDDYDGVIAQYPAYNVINMWLGAQAQARAIYGNTLGVPSPAWSSPTKVATLVAAVRNACDALDGVADGVISDVRACNAAYTIDHLKATLRCAGGTDTGDTCLSDAQIAAVEKIGSPVAFNFAFAGGSTSYPRWPILEGGTFLSNHLGRTNTADLAKFPFVPDGTAFQLFPAKGGIQGFITQNLGADPLAFEPDNWITRIQQVSGWTDAVSTDLRRFARKGGKMLVTHGTVDDSISPHNTIAYWNKLVAANGEREVERFARFYLIAGYGHGSGLFTAQHDWLATLEAWVERDRVPQQLVASDGNTAAATATTNGRTRPLCEYGSWPKYVGPAAPTQAQANDAANFACTRY
jgi:pimeloyl-ACP methyl ester carboxylesterase